jgi:hypothetical protein
MIRQQQQEQPTMVGGGPAWDDDNEQPPAPADILPQEWSNSIWAVRTETERRGENL